MTTDVLIPEKALAESNVVPFTALTVGLRATLLTAADRGGAATQQLLSEAARLGLDMTQPVQWMYTGVNGDETNEFDLEIALPIGSAAPVLPNHPFQVKTFPAFHCLHYTYTGPWSEFMPVYDALFAQVEAGKYRHNQCVREVYSVVNLEAPDQCVTDIQIGLTK